MQMLWGPCQRCARNVDGRSAGSAVPIIYLNAPLVNGETPAYTIQPLVTYCLNNGSQCATVPMPPGGDQSAFYTYGIHTDTCSLVYARIHVHMEQHRFIIKLTPKKGGRETPSSYGQQPKAESCRRLMRTP